MTAEEFVAFLKRGKANVKSSYELAYLTDIPQREIGFVVSDLRKQGYLIGSVHGQGYYLIETEEELEHTIGHISKRKAGIDATIKALEESWGSR